MTRFKELKRIENAIKKVVLSGLPGHHHQTIATARYRVRRAGSFSNRGGRYRKDVEFFIGWNAANISSQNVEMVALVP